METVRKFLIFKTANLFEFSRRNIKIFEDEVEFECTFIRNDSYCNRKGLSYFHSQPCNLSHEIDYLADHIKIVFVDVQSRYIYCCCCCCLVYK